MSQDIAEQNIQMWKVKKLIKSLDSARGYVDPIGLSWGGARIYRQSDPISFSRAGTSMISLIIPPKVCLDRFFILCRD